MPYIAGLKASDGYIFVASNIAGEGRKNGSVVRISDRCGALILTSNEEQLQRLKKVLERCVSSTIKKTDDLADGLIDRVLSSLKREFQEDGSYKTRPLTFLLLIVGANRLQEGSLEHVYIRNRVTERKETERGREYVTAFDIEPSVPAGNIFYGESDIIQYLARQLPCRSLPLNTIKILVPLSLKDSPDKTGTLASGIEMASLSSEAGFNKMETQELVSLYDKARKADSLLIEGLNNFTTVARSNT
ncbi:MAG: hypothetical protein C4526_10785 [Nitrospiraceae bacterium]|nr:MAG: hypothetical protein C4526_10785 [Nitrospiraceae bacterium]